MVEATTMDRVSIPSVSLMPTRDKLIASISNDVSNTYKNIIETAFYKMNESTKLFITRIVNHPDSVDYITNGYEIHLKKVLDKAINESGMASLLKRVFKPKPQEESDDEESEGDEEPAAEQ